MIECTGLLILSLFSSERGRNGFTLLYSLMCVTDDTEFTEFRVMTGSWTRMSVCVKVNRKVGKE